MINTINIDTNMMEAAFYDERFYFSPTSLNTILEDPSRFYNEYVLKRRKRQYAKHLLEGVLIHFQVLQDSTFDEKFIIAPEGLPSPKNMEVLDHIYDLFIDLNDPNLMLLDFRKSILEKLEDMDYYQNLKDTDTGTGDDKRMGKVADIRAQEYFEFLKESRFYRKDIVSAALVDECVQRANIILQDNEMRELLGLDLQADGRRYGVYNELDLRKETLAGSLKKLPFGIRGILDNCVVDVRKKLIRVNDVKTTGSKLINFKESVEKWNYWLQPSLYIRLVKHYFQGIFGTEWKIEFNFLVFDKYDHLYAFPVSDTTLKEWDERTVQALHEAHYHYENKSYDLPYLFAKGDITL